MDSEPPANRARMSYRLASPGETVASLLAILAERIKRDGPLTWAAFMRAALYHPDFGYYRAPEGRIGAEGDFLTAPEHHPAFGRLVGRRVVALSREMGTPSDFTVVEQGAGLGGLALGVLTELREAGLPVHYRIVEPLSAWQERQAERLLPFAGQVEWHESLDNLSSFQGIFLSNELPDAFPSHRVVHRAEELLERYVTQEDGRLTEIEGPLSTPALRRYFDQLQIQPAEGCVVEVCLELEPWVRAVCGKLLRGSFLTIDYGATAEELYLRPRRAEGTLRAYQSHAAVDPLASPGQADLTTNVDFTTLIRVAQSEGLELRAFTTQRDFLQAMGWQSWLNRPDAGSRKALMELIDPRLMGGTRVAELRRE